MNDTKTDRELLYDIANLVGAPTMDYAPEYKAQEMRDRLDKVSALIIAHLGLRIPEEDPEKYRTNPGLTITIIGDKKYVGGPLSEYLCKGYTGKVPGKRKPRN